jgi:hypothetical protein
MVDNIQLIYEGLLRRIDATDLPANLPKVKSISSPILCFSVRSLSATYVPPTDHGRFFS